MSIWEAALLLLLVLSSMPVLAVEAVTLSDGFLGGMDNSESSIALETPSFSLSAIPWSAWLWWVLIAYMFKAQATICDDYFVESIKVVVARYHIPEDVAGATLMALGCNGPELFTNFISIFITHSDVGIGTIVGSEIFNLLAIIGGSVLVAPQLPLWIQKASFVRDVSFYTLSIVLLTITLWDGHVSPLEAWILLTCAALFAIVVAYTRRITAWIEQLRADSLKLPLLDEETAEEPGCPQDVPAPADDGGPVNRALPVKAVVPPMGEAATTFGQLPMQIQVRGRNVAYHLYHASTPPARVEAGYREESCGQLTISTVASRDTLELRRGTAGVVSLSSTLAWNATVGSGKVGLSSSSVPRSVSDEMDGTRVVTPIACRSVGGDTLVEVEVSWDYQGRSSDTRATLLIDAETPTEKERLLCELAEVIEQQYVGGWKPCLRRLRDQLRVDDGGGLVWRGLRKAVHLLCFPIYFCLAISMGFCDVRDPSKEARWLPGFLLSMAWLAVFSYLMCYSADRITESFGIPSALMGVTVCAVGTSFPNFYASLIMAKAGRSSMAIANALGSNIQNIFIALALPWIVRTMTPSPHLFFVGSAGIFANVLAMAVTLLVLLVLVARGRMALDRTAGYVLIGAYVIYLVFAIWQS
ncbi:hypothetical protein FOZ60_009437 [Perkinsus olseni]|uniref:Sodium/calcium exchanger membrane region domain-containing protein n=1 Tax=Perkinsus olseni TaxID=32597 RepID=A0A7J6PCT0_PEROL|nr:hypothetical protein FOZ60_009437 [Perkinsus olseni]